MQEVFEKIIDKLKQENIIVDDDAGNRTIEIIKQAAAEYNDGWIPCSERLPEEHDSIFAKFKGTKKWNKCMFEKTSDEVNITVADEKGEVITTHAGTTDGEWNCDLLQCNKKYRVIAWQPLPEPYQSNADHPKKTNFDRCCESIEDMAQIIEIAKIGWTKDQIIEWLQKEAEE